MTSSASPPAPPDDFADKVHVEDAPPGTALCRVHQADYAGNEFHPGPGHRTRFGFFGDPLVPLIYAGATEEVGVFESVFHDTVPGAVVRRVQWETRLVSELKTLRPLRLAKFHSTGLRCFGLYPRDLTDTRPTTYPQTVLWSQAAHSAGLDGCVWMSRQFNTDRAYVLFGDRVGATDLQVVGDPPRRRVFADPLGYTWLSEMANRIDVTLLP
jgi:hypothetical protein